MSSSRIPPHPRPHVLVVDDGASMKNRLLIPLGLLLCTGNVYAEGNCPPGYYPIGGPEVQGCAPMNTGSGGAPPDPGPQWAKRWGAMAYDSRSGGFGGVDGLPSKRKAQKAAVAGCRQNGGNSCKVISIYYNQCGAMAWGNKRYFVWRGPDPSDNVRKALSDCNQSGGTCEIFHNGCSYPERVR
jgi:hypothetical protein